MIITVLSPQRHSALKSQSWTCLFLQKLRQLVSTFITIVMVLEHQEAISVIATRNPGALNLITVYFPGQQQKKFDIFYLIKKHKAGTTEEGGWSFDGMPLNYWRLQKVSQCHISS